MELKLPNLSLDTNRPYTLTQAYHAGALCFTVNRQFAAHPLPPLSILMTGFKSLPTLLGRQIWNKLKRNKNTASRVRVYEMLSYQPFLPKDVIGGESEFCLGYARVYKNSSTYINKKTETENYETILTYLSNKLNIKD